MFLWAFDEREHQQQQQQQQQQIAKKKHVDDGHFKEQSSLGTLFRYCGRLQDRLCDKTKYSASSNGDQSNKGFARDPPEKTTSLDKVVN